MQIEYNNPRYRIETFYSPSLEQNKVGDDPNKKVKIYLPPGYFSSEKQTKRYPTIYSLHGYGQSLEYPIFYPNQLIKENLPFLARLMWRKALKLLLTYERIDKLISRKEMKPFILVQADGNFPLPNYFKTKNMVGKIGQKGSFFMNSPYTGNYEDYVFKDLIKYVDKNFRTLASKSSRALLGVSMGGFSALLGGIKHPDTFNAVVAISPLIKTKDMLTVLPISPMYEKTLGREKAELEHHKDLIDMMDTVDMILYEDHELIENDELKEDIDMKLDAMDLNLVLNQYPNAFMNTNLAMYCEEKDELEFASQIREFEQSLKSKNIPSTIDIFSSEFCQKTSSHQFGLAFRIKEAVTFCLENMDS